MKRLITVFILLLLALLMGCIFANEKFSDKDLKEFKEEANLYFQTLDLEKNPVVVDGYDGEYSLKILNGELAYLRQYNGETSSSLSLDYKDYRELAEDILSDAAEKLNIVKTCLNNNLYDNLTNDPHDTVPYIVSCSISVNGLNLFPEKEEVDSVMIYMISYESNEKENGAILLGKQYRIPSGLEMDIHWKDGTVTYYLFGDAYRYY